MVFQGVKCGKLQKKLTQVSRESFLTPAAVGRVANGRESADSPIFARIFQGGDQGAVSSHRMAHDAAPLSVDDIGEVGFDNLKKIPSMRKTEDYRILSEIPYANSWVLSSRTDLPGEVLS